MIGPISSNRFHIPDENRHALILAGGDGTRLRSLTRAIAGDERPKQFCPILGGETLLDVTRERASIAVRAENIHFSLTEKHRPYFDRPLWNVRAGQLAVQPENKGTAPAILFSLMRLARIDPKATVVLLPSDHYFADDEMFMRNVDSAFDAVRMSPQSVVMLGIEPDKAETSYGWIEPAKSLFGDLTSSFSRVNRFWEKPTAGVAERLFVEGCLWNSFVMVGRLDAFFEMFRKHLPEMFRMFDASAKLLGTREEKAVVRAIYEWIAETNFSSEVLERAASDLLVMRVGDVGWSDWGEPARVISTFDQLGIKPRWAQAFAA